jgi:hypothetical protein
MTYPAEAAVLDPRTRLMSLQVVDYVLAQVPPALLYGGQGLSPHLPDPLKWRVYLAAARKPEPARRDGAVSCNNIRMAPISYKNRTLLRSTDTEVQMDEGHQHRSPNTSLMSRKTPVSRRAAAKKGR